MPVPDHPASTAAPGPAGFTFDPVTGSAPIPPPKTFRSQLRYPSSRKTIYDRNLNRTASTSTSLPARAIQSLFDFRDTAGLGVMVGDDGVEDVCEGW